MNIKEYHAHKALGSTSLKEILQNAKKFKLMQDGELEIKGKALDIGQALHTVVLEPELFDEEFVVTDIKVTDKIKELAELDNLEVYPAECLTPSGAVASNKKAKEILATLNENLTYVTPIEASQIQFYRNNKDKIALSEEDLELVHTLKDKLMKLKNFEKWLEAGVKEQSFFGEIDGVEVKCRPDLMVKLADGTYLVIDLKTTTADAIADAFVKTSANFLYYLQEAHYREVLAQNGIEVSKFIFAVTSKLEWAGAGYFTHDYIALEQGQELLRKAIQKYKYCLANDIWLEDRFDFTENKFEAINEVSLPAYSFYQFI